MREVGRGTFVRGRARPAPTDHSVLANGTALVDCCDASIRNQARWHRLKQRTVTPESRHSYDRHHSAIVTALRERDAERARQAMVEHLTMVRDHLLGAVG